MQSRTRNDLWTYLVPLVAAAASFADLAEEYVSGALLVRVDLRLTGWLHTHAADSLVTAARAITLAGSAPVLVTLVAAVAIALWHRGKLDQAALLLAALVGTAALNAALKLAFQRARPETASIHLDPYSFPSGHSSGSVAVYGALAFLAVRRWERRRTGSPGPSSDS